MPSGHSTAGGTPTATLTHTTGMTPQELKDRTSGMVCHRPPQEMLSKDFGEAGSSLATSGLGGPVSTATSPGRGLLPSRSHVMEGSGVGMGNWSSHWGRNVSSKFL